MFDKKMFFICLACALLTGLALTFGVLDSNDLTGQDKTGMIIVGWIMGITTFVAVSCAMKTSRETVVTEKLPEVV